MKTKVKLASILAALLLGACADPLSTPVDESAASGESGEHTVIFPADPNKGLVLLSVNGAPSAARVVLPDLSGASYSYRWYAETEDTAVPATERQNSGDFTPDAASPLAIELEPARWTLAVRAWTGTAPAEDAEEPPVPAFTGRTELALGAGAAQPLTIGLLPNGDGRGTFSYNVSLPDVTPGYAFISVFPLDGGGAVDVIDLKSNQTGTRTLTSGYYNITTAVNYKDGLTQKFAAKREVLYIYDDLTSSYAVAFETEDFTALLPAIVASKIPSADLDIYGYAVRTFDKTNATAIWNSSVVPNTLSKFLARTPQNTPDTPYFIALTGFKLNGTEITVGRRLGNAVDPLEDMFAATQGRYVFYDLSGCTENLAAISDGFAPSRRMYADRVVGVILPDACTTIGDYTFAGSTSLMYIGLGSKVTSIGLMTFRNCTSLRYITLPDTVNSVDVGAFYNSGLRAIDIPAGVGALTSSYNIFTSCTDLKSITLRSTSIVTTDNTSTILQDVPITADDFHIYVPSALVETYKDDTEWKKTLGENISRIIQAIP